MTTPEPTLRVTLPKPERTAPLRTLATVGRSDDRPADGVASAQPGRPLLTPKDVIEHAIHVAQEVIDQQIGSGERILRHLRRAPIRKRPVSLLDAENPANLTERTMVLTREFSVLALEALQTLAETPTVVEVIAKWLGLAPRPNSGTGGGSATVTTPQPATCAAFVSSRGMAKVDIKLFGTLTGDAQVLGLHRPDVPPITSIAFVAAARAFEIRVPDEQPGGTYVGVITSAADGQALGTITVTLLRE